MPIQAGQVDRCRAVRTMDTRSSYRPGISAPGKTSLLEDAARRERGGEDPDDIIPGLSQSPSRPRRVGRRLRLRSTGERRELIPVRVGRAGSEGLLGPTIYIVWSKMRPRREPPCSPDLPLAASAGAALPSLRSPPALRPRPRPLSRPEDPRQPAAQAIPKKGLLPSRTFELRKTLAQRLRLDSDLDAFAWTSPHQAPLHAEWIAR